MTEPHSDSSSDSEATPSASSAPESTKGPAGSTSDRDTAHEIVYHLAWMLEDPPTEFPEPLAEDLRAILCKIADRKDTAIRDMTVTAGYIHLVVESPPHYSPEHIATWFKNVSGKRFEQSHPENGTSITWADGQFAGTAGENGHAAVRRYLEARLPDDVE